MPGAPIHPGGTMRKVCCAITVGLLLGTGTIAAAQQGTVTRIALSPTAADTGTTVTATVTGSEGVCGAVHINWGDGDAITYPTSYLPVTKTHVYNSAGNFSVRAQGMGNCAGEATARIAIRGPAAPPASPAPGPRLTAVTLPQTPVEPGTAAAIRLDGAGACRVRLDFGDGANLELDATLPATVKHTFAAAGRYTVIATPEAPCTERRGATLDVGRPRGGNITGVEIQPQAARPGDAVTITVKGTGTCAIVVDFDDGKDRRVTERLPYRFSYTFAEARDHEIIVWTDEPCTGSGEAIARVRRRR